MKKLTNWKIKKLTVFILSVITLIGISCALHYGSIEAHAYTSGYYTYSVYNGKATITEVDSYISGDIDVPSTLGGYPVTTIDTEAFYNCSYLTGVTLPETVTSIGTYAFSSCNYLSYIDIPDSVISIASNAFYNCDSLSDVTLSNNITAISSYLFYDCDALEHIEIPEGVTTIDTYAFYSCSSLESIVLPSSLLNINSYAFYYCYYIVNVHYLGTSSQWSNIYKGSNNTYLTSNVHTSYDYDNDNRCDECGYIINDFVNYYSYYIQGSEATIQNVDKTIYGYVEIPDNIGGYPVTAIGDEAFYNCDNIISITMPDTVTSIGNYAFSDCDNMVNITLPDNILSIGDYAFSSCDTLGNIAFPEGLETIGDCCFSFCVSFTEVYIPSSLYSIGEECFIGCQNVYEFIVDDYNYYYESYEGVLFDEEISTLYQYSLGHSREYYEIPETVTTVSKESFSYAQNLYDVYISESVSNIDYFAFCDCNYLQEITVSGDNEYYSSLDGILFNKNRTVLIQCPGGTTITEYTVPDSVATISYYAFYCCSSIEKIYLGNSVTQIYNDAFSECHNLTDIVLPTSLSYISNRAFLSSDSLVNVHYCGTQDQWDLITINADNDVLTENVHMLYDSDADNICDICNYEAPRVPEYNRQGIEIIYEGSVKTVTLNEGMPLTSFSFTPEETGIYVFSSSSSTDLFGAIILAEDMGGIYAADDNTTGDFTVVAELEEGKEYYLCPSLAEDMSECTFTVTVIRDDSADPDSGLYLTFDEGNEKYISLDAGKSKVFTVIPKITGTYTITADSSSDTYCALFDSDNNRLTYDDDSGADYNFSITYDLQAGERYYYNVYFLSDSTSGSFNVYFTADSYVINEGETIELTPESAPFPYIKFIPDDTAEYTIFSSGDEDPYCSLLDENYNQIVYDDDGHTGLNFIITCELTEGETYYLNINYYGALQESTFVSVIKEEVEEPTTEPTTQPTTRPTTQPTTRPVAPSTRPATPTTRPAATTRPAHVHTYSSQWTVDKAATCTRDGSKSRHCTTCSAKTDVTVIRKTGHNFVATSTVKATTKKDGLAINTCQSCRATERSTVYRIKSAKLSSKQIAYTGKAQKPAVIIKDIKGNTLKKGIDYTVKYSKGRKKIGSYTVKITYKGKYSGTKSLKFKVVLGKVKGISQLSRPGIQFVWDEVKGASGYEIYRYNTSTKKYVLLAKTKGASLGSSGATGSMKFKIRAFKKSGKKTYYGKYSAAKTLKAK